MGIEASSSGNSNADLRCDANGCHISASAEGGFSAELKGAKGVGVSFGLSGEAASTHDVSTEDGVTTYTAEASVSVTLELGADGRRAGASFAHTEGIAAQYQVSMPEDAATPGAMAAANPFDPATMPEGTVIRVDSSHFSETEFSATFREISIANNLSESEGSSLVVERVDADVVRVTTGPTEGIDAYTSVGVDFEFASASLANNTSLDGSTFQSAEFDLSTPQGREAYNDFLVTGSMPADNGTGVANVQTVQTIDYHSQTDLEATLGPVDFTFEGGANTVNSVVITQPDGTSTQTLRASYFDGLPLTITRSFDANGTEILADRTYSYELEATNESAQLVNIVSTGDVASADSGPVDDGDTVTITLTHAQMAELQQLTVDTVDAVEQSHTLDGIAESETPLDFALHLARNFSDSGQELAETLYTISSGADGDVRNDFEPLPIDVDVQARTNFLASMAAQIVEQQGANG